jgi:hypothetical protein
MGIEWRVMYERQYLCIGWCFLWAYFSLEVRGSRIV